MIKIKKAGTNPNSELDVSSITVGQGTLSAPSLAFGDGDTGIFETSDDNLRVVVAGAGQVDITSTIISGTSSGNPAIYHSRGASASAPMYSFIGDDNTGVGTVGADQLSLITGGIEAIRAEDPADLGATETSLWLYDLDNGAIQQVTVGAAESGGAGFKVLRIPN